MYFRYDVTSFYFHVPIVFLILSTFLLSIFFGYLFYLYQSSCQIVCINKKSSFTGGCTKTGANAFRRVARLTILIAAVSHSRFPGIRNVQS